MDRLSRAKGNITDFRKLLYGKIEYDLPSADTVNFDGYLKLKKDPKGENLTIENLILRGSTLVYTEWFI